MKLINVYVEHSSMQLNQLFTYSCPYPVSVGCRVKINFANREVVGFVEEVDVTSDCDRIKEVIEVLDTKPLLNMELMQLAQYISTRFVCNVISVYKTMLPPALKPSAHHAKIIYEEIIVAASSNESLTKKQEEVYQRLLPDLPMKASLFRKEAKSIAKALLEKGYVQIEKIPKTSKKRQLRYSDTHRSLTKEQQAAIEQISTSENSCFLLHGVTGSGKTEVFLQLAQDVLAQGKQVLFLVPEIGLTPMMIERVMARFGESIAIYHSQLNAQEKYEQYCLVRDQKVSIVVGTRSACFMPFSNLGLILMDEEHDASYKQDNMPRYHTRDVALFRAKYHQCKLVLASATPSLESYARAYKGVYELVELKYRIYEKMPKIKFINLKKETCTNGISTSLIQAMQACLERKEQIILLLNRRGYLPTVRCANCNEVFVCPDCGIALTYHKTEDLLMCHSCGDTYRFDHECPHCHSHQFYELGMGTEKLEEQVQSLFPQAKIIRMDADSTRKKNAHARLLESFETSGDILIGTQMVAKGLDFPRVTLVGILQADQSLLHSEYRSCEMAYQMLEQASGRSGRGRKEGNVLIQTYDPDHYVMQCVLHHDYLSFFKKEMAYRHLGLYPPYVYLCTIIYSHSELPKALQVAKMTKTYLQTVQVLGPVEISMRNQKKRVRLVIKAKSEQFLEDLVWDLVSYHKKMKTNVKQDINMYPLGLEE